MNRLNRYALSVLALSAMVAILAGVNATPTQAGPVVTGTVNIGNTPLPVVGTIDIGGSNATLPVSGTVAISNSPTVQVANLPSRVPYNFRLSGGFDTNGVISGNETSFTIPAGKIFEMQHVACEANIENETESPLILSLTTGSIPDQVFLVSLQVPQLGGYKRSYWVTQETHAFLGPVSNRSFGNTVNLHASVWDHFGFADCYVSGELIN
jgi:hypothetical protein